LPKSLRRWEGRQGRGKKERDRNKTKEKERVLEQRTELKKEILGSKPKKDQLGTDSAAARQRGGKGEVPGLDGFAMKEGVRQIQKTSATRTCGKNDELKKAKDR